MTGYLIFWGVSAVSFVAFFSYWVWRLDCSHRRRMSSIIAAEEETRAWAAEAAKFRADHLAAEGRDEPAPESPTPRPAPVAPGAA